MSDAKSLGSREPSQLAREPQRSLWDAILKASRHGSFSFPSEKGVRVFSTSSPVSSFRPNEVLANRLLSTRARQGENAPALQARTIKSVLDASPPPLDQEHFRILAAFDGTVLDLNGDSFLARLVNKIDPSDVREEADFVLAEVPEADHDLIKVGSMFYWHIGITEKPHGQQTKTSLIRFRRLPAWEQPDIEAAKTRAEFLHAVLPLDGAESEA